MDPNTLIKAGQITTTAVSQNSATARRRFNEAFRAEFIPVLRKVSGEAIGARRPILIAAVRAASDVYFHLERPEANPDLPEGLLPFDVNRNYPCGICGHPRGVTQGGECNDCGLQAACWIDDGTPPAGVPVFGEIRESSTFPSATKVVAFTFRLVSGGLRKTNATAARLTDAITRYFVGSNALEPCTPDERQALVKALVSCISMLIYERAEPLPGPLPDGIVIDPSVSYHCSTCTKTFRMKNAQGQCANCELQCPAWILSPEDRPSPNTKS